MTSTPELEQVAGGAFGYLDLPESSLTAKRIRSIIQPPVSSGAGFQILTA